MRNKEKYVKVVSNFITDNEKKILSEWTLKNYQEPYFVDAKMNSDLLKTRFTTRHAYGRHKKYQDFKVQYPKEVYEIQNRLFEYLNLSKLHILPFPAFSDGIITTICFSPGSCFKHKDPIYYPDTYTLHCNFCPQQPEIGGITIVEDEKIYFKENDLIMYVSSHLNHEVTELFGDKPRILWVFGFHIDFQEMDKIFNIETFKYL